MVRIVSGQHQVHYQLLNNNITGTWSPATISTASQGTTTYPFTPCAVLCYYSATMQVTVNANITFDIYST
ncbi:MAG: hypothetical protein IPP71_20255 [Bacteroidetes bacterium]|nr:hypothetical protein [Bacteroidota bacterium]